MTTRSVFLALWIICTIAGSRAATITWTGCKSNDWHLSTNWNPKQVPTYLDLVVIPTVTTYPVITGIGCCSALNITSAATDALTINTTVGGILHFGNSTPVPLVKKIVFVSSVTQSSTTSAATRDTRCNTDATASLCGGTYKAWVSNAGANNVPSTTNIQYVLPNGTKVADNWADLIDGSLDNGINLYASGAVAPGAEVWTGLTSAGGASANGTTNCGGWGNQTSTGRIGLIGSATSTWTDQGFLAPCEDIPCPNINNAYIHFSINHSLACSNCFGGSPSGQCCLGANPRVIDATTCATDGNPGFSSVNLCCNPGVGVANSYRHYCFQQ